MKEGSERRRIIRKKERKGSEGRKGIKKKERKGIEWIMGKVKSNKKRRRKITSYASPAASTRMSCADS